MYAETTKPALKIRLENENDQLFYLEKSSGIFKLVDGEILLSSGLVISFEKNDRYIVNVSSNDTARFSIAFAFFTKGAWRMRVRLLKTTDVGAIAFPMFKTFPNTGGIYTLPDNMANTILVLGIHCVDNESMVRVKAIDDGRTIPGNFVYNRIDDSCVMSDSLKRRQNHQADANVVSIHLIQSSDSVCIFISNE